MQHFPFLDPQHYEATSSSHHRFLFIFGLIGHSKGDGTENKFRKCPGGPHCRVFGLFGLDLGLGSQSMPGVPGMSVFSSGTVFKMQVYWESS